MPRFSRSFFLRYVVALVSVIVATALRLLLDPWLGSRFPFATLFFAVLVAAWYGGFGPAVAAALVGALASIRFLLPPRESFAVVGFDSQLGLVLYLLVSLGIAALGGAMRAARKRAELLAADAVRQREQLRTTLRSIGDAVIVTDSQAMVRSLNPVAEQLTGWTTDEATGQPLATIFPIYNENTDEPVASPVTRVLQEGVVVGLANHSVLTAKDGTARPIDDSAAPIRDAHGDLVGVVLVFRDVTERRRAERELQRQREWFRVTLASIGDAVIATDLKGRVSFLNPVAQTLTGWTQEEAERQPLETVFRIVNEYTRQPVESPVLQALREGTIIGLANHTRLLAKDGTERPIDDSAAPIQDEQGNLLGVVLIFRDVTERRRAEETRRRLAAIVASSDDAIVGKTLEGIITSWNTGAERLYGYPATEVVGKPFSILVPPDRSTEVEESVRRLQRGERLDHFETVRRRKDGQLIDVSVSYSPIRDDEGRCIGTAVITRDIGERKRAERSRHARFAVTQALAQASDLAEAAPDILQALCEGLGCKVGALWTVDREAGLLRRLEVWHRPTVHADTFAARIRSLTLDPDSSLAGRVWTGKSPVWMPDVTQDARFLRRDVAVDEEMHGAFAFPIQVEAEVFGVIELFSDTIRQPDSEVLEMLATIGGQIGQFLERRRAEEQLRRSERELADFFENATVGLHWVGPDGTILRVNQAELDLLGYTREEYVGHHIAELHVDQGVISDILRRLGAGEELHDYPAQMRCKDGSLKDVLIGSSVLWEDGQFVHTRCFTRDVTERKRTEQTTRFLADASAALASLVDYESTLQKVARLAVPFFADWCTVDMLDAEGLLRRVAVAHVDPAKVELAHELRRRHPPDPDAPHGVWHILRTGEAEIIADISDHFLEATVKDGELLRILRELGLKSYLGVPLAIRGKVLGVLTFIAAESGRRYDAADLAVAKDLAQRAAVAMENAQLYQALRDADRRKDEFLALLGHELRNPLAPIRNALHVLRLPGADGAITERARAMMERQVEHLVRMVDDLLDVSRIMRGKVELRREPVELATVVARAVETAQPVIDAEGHELTLTLPSEPLWVNGDLVRLAQVVSNLLHNAAKYTERGGRIWLTAAREGGQGVLRVRDTGIGIGPDQLTRIFDMFFQAERRTKDAQGGLGIGLSLVRGLIEMHGGQVEAHSAGPGRGSEFVVRLLLLVRDTTQDERAPRAGASPAERLAPCRVLVVDDSIDAADSLAMLLRLEGLEVRVAYDGPSALEQAEADPPTIAFLDLGMPKMDGYELARRFRAHPVLKSVNLVALTGWGQPEDRQRTKEAGFDHHFVKPVEPEALHRLLRGQV